MSSATLSSAPVIIREAATVALLADMPSGGKDRALRVLLLRRADSHVFGAGADVFPGGAVDTADHELAAGDTPEWADGAYRIAAIRECFEEAGLLIATDGCHCPPARRAEIRAALCAGTIGWAEATTALGAVFEPSRLVAFARWTTPAGLPKRYATRFYAVAADHETAARADGHETVAAAWVTPAAALADADAGRRRLMVPTQATLTRLAGYENTGAALAALAAAPEEIEP